ncbi:MAG TPA: RNA polymerase sporulation sigma factor SigH [Virgibacillus sp.]|nr:RNA polymerase sporulation sigma factor SigH [Virgibacillus sp.]
MTKVKEVNGAYKRMRLLVDEELLQLIDQGNSQALECLIQKYKGVVWGKAQTYFLIGGDREDIIQEGMIGLYKAILDYDEEKLASFRGFADLCITRQIITAIKTATRQKHIPLNSYISLDKPIYDEESDRTLLDTLSEQRTTDPQAILMAREKFGYVDEKLSENLSILEQKVLRLYIDGYTYLEISKKLNRHIKSIDNALQRVKRKLEELLVLDEFNL